MVHHYKRKTQQASWSEETMRKAMDEAKTSSIRSASKKYGIPIGTLHRHIKKGEATKTLGRFRPVFSKEIERQIVELAVELDACFYGLTMETLKNLAYQLAVQNKIPHPFQGQQAGKAWIEGFMKRHPQLTFRSPEPTSISRCSAFNRTQVDRFYDNLWHVLCQHDFMSRPDDIYNMDETGVKTSASHPPRVIAVKEEKQVGVISSAEKGQLTTIICACSATGRFVPPCFIFGKRKRMNARLLDDAPNGAQGWCSDSGWTNNENYNNWLQVFIEKTRPTKEKPVLLIMDNHASHQNLDGLNMARENNIIIVSIPPHTSHKLQPLDVSIYGPFKAAFERAIDMFQKNHPGRRITQFDVAKLVRTAFEKSATVQNATNGFRKTGIFPYNRDLFTDLDFAPAMVHENQPIEQLDRNSAVQNTQASEEPDHDSTSNETMAAIEEANSSTNNTAVSTEVAANRTPEQIEESALDTTVPTKEHQSDLTAIADRKNHKPATNPYNEASNLPSTSSSTFVSPKQIIPVPKVTPAIKKRKIKAQQSEIITSSPFKATLEKKAEMKRKKPKQKNRKISKIPKLNSEDQPKDHKVKGKGKGKKTKMTDKENRTENQEQSSGEVSCSFCGELYIDPPQEDWVQCQWCHNWAHELCADVVKGQFECIICP